ncbi:MAG: hypothetical protein ABW001_02755 [Mycobacterium sp.]
MRLVADAGVWTAGPAVAGVPAVAVLEVSGAVLAWTVDDQDGAAATRMTVTDVVTADWLWRVVGPAGHAAIVAGAELAEIELLPGVFAPLRRLAIGHWLRRWWPESLLDGIGRLDRALLDGEIAVLTDAAQEFFTEDTLDSDVAGLLGPHRTALLALERDDDPRVGDLVQACAELADQVGAWVATETPVALADSDDRRRSDYALAAGATPGRAAGAIARGVGSVDWVAVPPGTFDAAEDTIDWSIEAIDSSVLAPIRVALTGTASPRGVDVRLRAGNVTGAGVLDGNGTAALTLVGRDGLPLTENEAWDRDWSTTAVTIGADVPGEGPEIRQRVRTFAMARLARPGPDAFLAEIIAAESDY